jgi:hypothetical protein
MARLKIRGLLSPNRWIGTEQKPIRRRAENKRNEHETLIGPDTNSLRRSDMNNKTENNPQQQKQQGQQDRSGSAKTSDAKPNPAQGNQSQGSPQQRDMSKKSPSTDKNPHHKDQQQPEDAKKQAS